MEAPPVQYATTSDGVSIAWDEMGDGPPLLLCAPTPFTHVQELPVLLAPRFEAVARSFRCITFDARGVGMSERDVEDVSSATLLSDAEAVLDAAKIDRCPVFVGAGNLLPFATALQLAIEAPERVTHLALVWPYQSMRDVADTPYAKVGLALAEADWRAYAQAFWLVLSEFDADYSGPIAKAAATWADPCVGLLYRRLEEATDLGDLLRRVRQPTLVLSEEQQIFVPVRCSQRVAAKIPGAQFRRYAHARGERSLDLILPFLGLTAPSPSAETQATVSPAGMTAILFADIADSTGLTERLGDAAFRARARALDVSLRGIIREFGGTPVEGKLLGDGVLAVFTSAKQAVDSGLLCAQAGDEDKLPLHLGIHAGDVIREDDNVYGGAVNIAARISGLSTPGEVLVSDIVRGLARTSAAVTFEDRGEHALKGVSDPQRVFAVRRAD